MTKPRLSPVSENGSNPHEQSDVTVVTVSKSDPGKGDADRPFLGDAMYPLLLAEAANAGHITEEEFDQRNALHKVIERVREARGS